MYIIRTKNRIKNNYLKLQKIKGNIIAHHPIFFTTSIAFIWTLHETEVQDLTRFAFRKLRVHTTK